MSRLTFTLLDAARAMDAAAPKAMGELVLTGVSTDTRTIEPGQLFFALRGENFDGHDYVGAALDKGAAAAVTGKDFKASRGMTVIKVEDTLRALGDLAGSLRRNRPLKVVALTGSNGKTTTKEMLVRMLSRRWSTLATQGNFNNLIGLPLTIFRLEESHRAAVLEMGMSFPGEIARLTEIAGPDVGLITNVGPAHLEGLGSLEGVARAKGELFSGLGPEAAAAVNMDDPLVVRVAEVFHGRKITFGFSRRADVRAARVRPKGLGGTSFELITPEGRSQVGFALLGRHNVLNALAAAAGALAMGCSQEDMAAGLEGFPPFPGRLELKKLAGPVYMLDDTYNANPASTIAALKVLTARRGKGRAVAALGDMLELGRAAKSEHERVGRTAAELGIDLLAAVGPNCKNMVSAARKAGLDKDRVHWFADAPEAGAWLKERLRPHDRLLVKGSRGMKMERIVKNMTGEETH